MTEKKLISILAGADVSIVGMKFKNHIVKKMYSDEFLKLVNYIKWDFNKIQDRVLDYGVCLVPTFQQQSDGSCIRKGSEIIFIETDLMQCNSLPWEFVDLLKLYKSEDIYCADWFGYQISESGKMFGAGIGHTNANMHDPYPIPKEYALSLQELSEFNKWYEMHNDILNTADCSEQWKKALRFYQRAMLTSDISVQYVLLTIILEVVFCGDRNQLSYQIARGASLLLSQNIEEMAKLNKSIKDLYNKRSKFVHEGTSISISDMKELREYCRRILLKVYEKGFHKNEDFTKLQRILLVSGYESLHNLR